MPDKLEDGILYISYEFETAIHLCACGCGEKTVTQIRNGEWSLKMENNKPTLTPSIGNFQIPCRSHYFITNGMVVNA